MNCTAPESIQNETVLYSMDTVWILYSAYNYVPTNTTESCTHSNNDVRTNTCPNTKSKKYTNMIELKMKKIHSIENFELVLLAASYPSNIG